MSKHGDSIYGTRGGPIPPSDLGVSTQKDDKFYIHVLDWNAPMLALSPLPGKITEAHTLGDNVKIEFMQNADGIILKLPVAKAGDSDRVIVLTVSGKK